MSGLITQDGRPPYTMKCWECGQTWEPAPVTRGPTKGEQTESSLDKSSNDHWRTCKGGKDV